LRNQIKTFAMGRVGIGVLALAVPRLFLRSWLGKGSNTPATRMLARMVGARDVALGMGVVFALNHDAPVRGWLEAATVADTGDFVATVIAFKHLPRFAAAGTALASLGGAGYGRKLVSALQSAAPAVAAPAGPAPSPGDPVIGAAAAASAAGPATDATAPAAAARPATDATAPASPVDGESAPSEAPPVP
jgi:peptide-methionine (R)-S-oxide reductase